MPFEDDYRMVLRMPMRIGSPPDIRLENGHINGVDSHKICGVMTATGLDDKPMAERRILTKGATGTAWFLVVSDFGFWLYLPMSEYMHGNGKNSHHILYVGAVSPLKSTAINYVFTTSFSSVRQDGYGVPWLYGINYSGDSIINLTSNRTHYLRLTTVDVDETQDGKYLAQRCLLADGGALPVYASISAKIDTTAIVGKITIGSRPMLRTPQRYGADYGQRVYYVPLDYWEL